MILLDDDIDPSDVNQVVWAFATRCHPEKDAHFYTHEKTLPLVHYLNAAEKKDLSSTKVIYNGLLPGFDRHEISGSNRWKTAESHADPRRSLAAASRGA